jgi:hypothetical protein
MAAALRALHQCWLLLKPELSSVINFVHYISRFYVHYSLANSAEFRFNTTEEKLKSMWGNLFTPETGPDKFLSAVNSLNKACKLPEKDNF